jgi:hypothetical protein
MLFVQRAGSSALVSARCDRGAHLWNHPPDYPTATFGTGNVRDFIPLSPLLDGEPVSYSLAPDGLANKHNTAAVRRDAQDLVRGFVLRYGEGHSAGVDLQFEDFGTHANATRFQFDYAEDHCREGDTAFAVPAVPGAVGFRCPCEGDIVDDRVSFVRGTTRMQVIVWGLDAREGHEWATEVAALVVSGIDSEAA